MWKLQNFSVAQILREIKVGEFSLKSAIWAHLKALNFDFYAFLHFQTSKIYQMGKI